MEIIIAFVLTIVVAFLIFMSEHIREEERQGKDIPLPWEKKDGE